MFKATTDQIAENFNDQHNAAQTRFARLTDNIRASLTNKILLILRMDTSTTSTTVATMAIAAATPPPHIASMKSIR